MADFTIKQSDPRSLKRRIYFLAVDVNNQATRLSAADMSGGTFTVRISKNGAASGTIAGSAPAEVGAANDKGQFYIDLAVADISTAGYATVKVTNTGGTKVMEQREILIEIPEAFFATAATGTLTASSFTSDRTEVSSFWKDAVVLARTGALAGQAKKIGAFANTGGLFTLATINGVQLAFTAAPANGDVFEILTT